MKTANLFIATIEELSGGTLQADLARNLNELVGMVRATSKKGSLTLKLIVAPSKGSELAVTIEPSLVVAPPKVEREITVFYADDANNLSRNDPRQPKLPTMGSATVARGPFRASGDASAVNP